MNPSPRHVESSSRSSFHRWKNSPPRVSVMRRGARNMWMETALGRCLRGTPFYALGLGYAMIRSHSELLIAPGSPLVSQKIFTTYKAKGLTAQLVLPNGPGNPNHRGLPTVFSSCHVKKIGSPRLTAAQPPSLHVAFCSLILKRIYSLSRQTG